MKTDRKNEVSDSEVFMKSRSRSFDEVSVSVLKITLSTISLLFSIANAKKNTTEINLSNISFGV